MISIKNKIASKIIIFLTAVYAKSIFAQDPTSAEENRVRAIHVTWDNDRFVKGGTDQWYTNGFRVDWTYERNPKNSAASLLASGVDALNDNGPNRSISYSVGQLLYTPKNIRESQPQFNDRPWGAFLYAGLASHADPGNGNVHTSTELKLGIVGPAALGDEVQSAVHKITGSAQPQGWDTQLKPRIGVQLSHSRTYRVQTSLSPHHIGFQVGYGGAIGSVRNYVNTTATILIGDLSGQVSPVQVGNENDFIVVDLKDREQYLKPFGFVSFTPTLMIYNYFLEGKTPFGENDLNIRDIYSTFQFGFSVPIGRWLFGDGRSRLMYRQSIRTKEFTSDSDVAGSREASHRWGTLEFYFPLN